MRKAKAFCPGHITGFFEIHRERSLIATGSRGAGLCLTLGAESTVSASQSARQMVCVTLNGAKSSAEITKAAVRNLIGKMKLRVNVETRLALPIGQGFGMSAAGALSSSIALSEILGDTRQRAFEAAHVAEIQCGGGLGDVAALQRGGVTIRKKAGLPPVGQILRIDGAPELVLAVVGRPIRTKSILNDPTKREAINRNGGMKVDQLLEKPTLDRLMRLSHAFTVESGLASRSVVEAIDAANEHGMASMSMLGNSVFAIGDMPKLRRVLLKHGKMWSCAVDIESVRFLQ